jgi:hypothetical protein
VKTPTTLEDAQAIVAACQQAGVLLMTAFPNAFQHAAARSESPPEAGDFGQVYCFNATNQGDRLTKHRAWFVDPRAGGRRGHHGPYRPLVDICAGSWAAKSSRSTPNQRIFYADEVEVETGALGAHLPEWRLPASTPVGAASLLAYLGWLTLEIHRAGAVIVDAFKQNLTVYSQRWQRPLALLGFGRQPGHGSIHYRHPEQRQAKVTGQDGLKVEVALAAIALQPGQPVSIE